MNMNDPVNVIISLPVSALLGFLVAYILGYSVRLQVALCKDIFSYPKVFRVSSYSSISTTGGMAYYGSDSAMSSTVTNQNRATVYVLHPDSQGFAKVLEKHRAKGKEIKSRMDARPLDKQLDFEKIEANGFKGFEYLLDHSLVDFTALRFFTSKDA